MGHIKPAVHGTQKSEVATPEAGEKVPGGQGWGDVVAGPHHEPAGQSPPTCAPRKVSLEEGAGEEEPWEQK